MWKLTEYKMISEDHVASIVDRYLSGSQEDKSAVVTEIVSKLGDPQWLTVPLRVLGLMRDRMYFNDVANLASDILNKGMVSDGAIFGICWTSCVAGHPNRVIAYLDQAFQRGVLSGDQALFLAVQHARLNDEPKARDLINLVDDKFDHLQQEVEIHRQFLDFYKNFQPDVAFGMLDDVKRQFKHLETDALEAEIRHALENKLPYLLLRLGDGEGSVIRVNDHDTSTYASYYAANQREFLRIWFDDESVGESRRFDTTIDEFNSVMRQADAIGGIYDVAVEHEYRLGSRRGIAWVVNTMRKVLALAENHPAWAARTSIHHLGVHYDLLLSGALARLLQGRKYVGVISCQADLPAALKRTYDIGEIEFYKIPGEKIHRDTLGQAAVEGNHWPERFLEICDVIDKSPDRSGQLFLVAAGMLGKIYASKLKATGAVVLDIGAVADLWMGKMTRTFPGLPDELALAPPRLSPLVLVDVGGLGGIGSEWGPYHDRIRPVVFEPNPPEAAAIRQQISTINDGLVVEAALSNKRQKRSLNVTRSLGCTSLLEPNTDFLTHYSIDPAFTVTHKVDVDCVRFDELMLAKGLPQPDVIKIDVQGFEFQVLEGFGDVLDSCLGVKLEAHLYPIYKGQKLLHDLVALLETYDLILRKVVPVDHFDGDCVEVDAWFTCGLRRSSNLDEASKDKLALIERVWELNPRRRVFSAEQFS